MIIERVTTPYSPGKVVIYRGLPYMVLKAGQRWVEDGRSFGLDAETGFVYHAEVRLANEQERYDARFLLATDAAYNAALAAAETAGRLLAWRAARDAATKPDRVDIAEITRYPLLPLVAPQHLLRADKSDPDFNDHVRVDFSRHMIYTLWSMIHAGQTQDHLINSDTRPMGDRGQPDDSRTARLGPARHARSRHWRPRLRRHGSGQRRRRGSPQRRVAHHPRGERSQVRAPRQRPGCTRSRRPHTTVVDGARLVGSGMLGRLQPSARAPISRPGRRSGRGRCDRGAGVSAALQRGVRQPPGRNRGH